MFITSQIYKVHNCKHCNYLLVQFAYVLFFCRMKVKSGLRLVSVTASNSRWAVTAEVKPRAATVTATRLEQPLRDDDGLDT